MVFYSFAPSYGILLIALSLMGLGGGVVEALINPLVQELHPKDAGRYLNWINAFWSVGVLATVLGTGDLLSREVSWRAIMGGLGGVSFASGFAFLLLRRKGATRARQSMTDVFKEKRQILSSLVFWRFAWMMFLVGSAEGAFTYWSASLIQLEHGGEPRAAGIGVALFAGGMLATRLLSGWCVPQSRLWELLVVSALAGVGVSCATPLLDGLFQVYVGLFFAGVSVACFWPSMQAYAVDRMSFEPMGVFILLSCGGVAGFAFVPWLMGAIGDSYGIVSSFWITPVFFALLAVTLLWERRSNGG